MNVEICTLTVAILAFISANCSSCPNLYTPSPVILESVNLEGSRSCHSRVSGDDDCSDFRDVNPLSPPKQTPRFKSLNESQEDEVQEVTISAKTHKATKWAVSIFRGKDRQYIYTCYIHLNIMLSSFMQSYLMINSVPLQGALSCYSSGNLFLICTSIYIYRNFK